MEVQYVLDVMRLVILRGNALTIMIDMEISVDQDLKIRKEPISRKFLKQNMMLKNSHKGNLTYLARHLVVSLLPRQGRAEVIVIPLNATLGDGLQISKGIKYKLKQRKH